MRRVLTSSFSVLLTIFLVSFVFGTPGFSSTQGLHSSSDAENFQSPAVFAPSPDYGDVVQAGETAQQGSLDLIFAQNNGEKTEESDEVRGYRESAEQGYAFDQIRMGEAYAEGKGVAKDEAEAVRWYRKAAEQENADAQNSLGDMYSEGKGVPKDEAEAIRWYRKAAEQGNAYAQFKLGIAYAEGKGVPKDVEEAKKWFDKARTQNHPLGYLGFAFLEMISGQFDEALNNLNVIIEDDVKFWFVYLLRGQVFLAKGDTSLALQDFKKANAFDIDDKDGHCEIMTYLAAVQMIQGDIKAAKTSIEEAIALDGKDRDALVLCGLILCSNGEYAEAETKFEQVLKKHPDFEPAFWGLSDAQFHLEKFQDAERTLNQIPQNKATQDLDEFDSLLFCPACFDGPFQTAALQGKLIEVAFLSNRKMLERSRRLKIKYLKNSRFLPVGVRPRMVSNSDALLFDPEEKLIVFPYSDVPITPEELVGRTSAQIVGDGELHQQTLTVRLKILADFSPARIMFNDVEFSLKNMTLGGLHFSPALRREYRLQFDLPAGLAAVPNKLSIESPDGKTHLFTLSLSEGKLEVAPMARPALDKL